MALPLAEVVQSLRPGEKFSLVGDTYAGLTWGDITTAPTEAELDAHRVTAAKAAWKKRLDKEFCSEIAWTDGESERHRKLVEVAANTAGDDTRWNETATFYKESKDHLGSQKTAVDAETTEAGIEGITYSPTHVKTRAQITGD